MEVYSVIREVDINHVGVFKDTVGIGDSLEEALKLIQRDINLYRGGGILSDDKDRSYTVEVRELNAFEIAKEYYYDHEGRGEEYYK